MGKLNFKLILIFLLIVDIIRRIIDKSCCFLFIIINIMLYVNIIK